ncbi:MAG: hypothetical protein K5640_02295 [Treponema sp.]|nr:hypothetical protein [Treponema sp.]
MKKMTRIFVKAVAALAFAVSPMFFATAEDIPFEVKFILDNKVLDESDKTSISKTYIEAFGLGKPTPINVTYLDNKKKAFNEAGWTNRLRVKGGAKKFEYTYKKRYAVTDGNIDAALALAKADGFADQKELEPEIDWGYSKMTLSYSMDYEPSNEGYGDLVLPELADGLKVAAENMPAIEANFGKKNWGTKALKKGKFVGPIVYKKYKGKANGVKVSVEVWPIENQKTHEVEYLAEFSFDADNYEDAKAKRQKMQDFLKELGVLKNVDSLKTSTVYNAYYN